MPLFTTLEDKLKELSKLSDLAFGAKITYPDMKRSEVIEKLAPDAYCHLNEICHLISEVVGEELGQDIFLKLKYFSYFDLDEDDRSRRLSSLVVTFLDYKDETISNDLLPLELAEELDKVLAQLKPSIDILWADQEFFIKV